MLWERNTQKIKQYDENIDYLNKIFTSLHQKKQGFYTLFSDELFLKEYNDMKIYAQLQKGKWNDIVVCGIGGSALGLLSLHQALETDTSVRLHVLESIDPDFIKKTHDSLDYKKTLFIFISKSGGTIETLAQYSFFTHQLRLHDCDISDYSVIITGSNGYLKDQSIAHNIPCFHIPENIGGRFSVLTSVGLLPALLLGIDTDQLLAGAKDMTDIFLETEIEKNTPYQFAREIFYLQKPIHVLMPYAYTLRNFSLWYAQLLAESTGKQGKGYTMLPTSGPTDQHSQLQLFSDGPSDKLIIFLQVKNFLSDAAFSADFLQKGSSFSFSQLIYAEMIGTKESLDNKNIPTFLISIEKISEYEMGQLFIFFQGVTAFLGEMLQINTFDQPGVEEGKIIAKKRLLS